MVHNDMNPRNIGFRRRGWQLRLCAYDWELATVDVPQRDLVEFLSFMELERTDDEAILQFIERHRSQVGRSLRRVRYRLKQWMQGFNLTLATLLDNRVHDLSDGAYI